MDGLDFLLAEIAHTVGGYPPTMRLSPSLDQYIAQFPYPLRLSITTDLDKTEAYYVEKHGKGDTIHVSLKDYEHGRQLAAHLYFKIRGVEPDMSPYTGEGFAPTDKLYLFIHIDSRY